MVTFIYPPQVQAGVYGVFDWIKQGLGVENKVLSATTVIATEEALSYPEPNINNISLLQAVNNPDPTTKETASKLSMIDGSAFTNENNSIDGSLEFEESTNDQISLYTVRQGDTVPLIAKMFGVTTNTIYWANDLKAGTELKPDQVIVILPVSGVKYTAKKGDTVELLAKKFKADKNEIADFNNIDINADLVVGQQIIVPNAKIETNTDKKTSKCKTKRCSSEYTAGYFMRPVVGGRKSQGIHGHNGIDIAAPMSTPIYAAASGQVVLSLSGAWNGGYGNYVVIKHPNGTQTLYGHMSQNLVRTGDRVEKGEQIGKMGSTGKSTGVHLHFEVRGGRNPF